MISFCCERINIFLSDKTTIKNNSYYNFYKKNFIEVSSFDFMAKLREFYNMKEESL